MNTQRYFIQTITFRPGEAWSVPYTRIVAVVSHYTVGDDIVATVICEQGA